MGVDVKQTYRLYQALMRVTPELASVDRTCTVKVAEGLPRLCNLFSVNFRIGGHDIRVTG